MNNLEYLIQKGKIKKRTPQLIKLKQYVTYDEEICICEVYFWYETSDGEKFGFPAGSTDSLDEAIKHEIEWLNSER